MLENSIPLFSVVELFDDTFFFLIMAVAVFGLVGMFSQSFLYGIHAAFVGFAALALESNYDPFITMLTALSVIIPVLVSFQVYNMMGENT